MANLVILPEHFYPHSWSKKGKWSWKTRPASTPPPTPSTRALALKAITRQVFKTLNSTCCWNCSVRSSTRAVTTSCEHKNSLVTLSFLGWGGLMEPRGSELLSSQRDTQSIWIPESRHSSAALKTLWVSCPTKNSRHTLRHWPPNALRDPKSCLSGMVDTGPRSWASTTTLTET